MNIYTKTSIYRSVCMYACNAIVVCMYAIKIIKCSVKKVLYIVFDKQEITILKLT